MAQQAFKFNKEHDGYKYDDAIYNGLHEALEKFNHALTLNLQGHDKGSARSLVIHVQSKQLYSGGSDGRILRWTYNGSKWNMEVLVGARSNYQVYSIAVNDAGTMLAAGGMAFGDVNNNYIELYDLKNMGAAPKKITGYAYDIDNIYFTEDGKGLYARDNSGYSIKFSDLNTSKEVIKSKEKINSIVINPKGTIMAGAGNDGSLFFWDLKNNYAEKVFYKNNKGLTAVGFTRDGKNVVIGDLAGLVRMITTDGAQRGGPLSGHTSGIEQIVFNHAGTFMATASNDKTVRLWNLDDLKKQPMVLSGHADWVRTAVYSADDEQLFAGMHSNAEKTEETIHAWPTKIETMSELLCQYLKRNLTEDDWETYVDVQLKYEKTCSTVADVKK
jgi:WD40 repeat protein